MKPRLPLLALVLLFATAAIAQGEVEQIRAAAHPTSDYTALLNAIGDRRFVLIGEASHGTAEFYRERARITRRLIEEKGLRAIFIEGNWSDVQRVDAYVRGAPDDDPLAGFTLFPAWQWRNTELAGFVRWLRGYNQSLPPGQPPVRLFGLDLYAAAESRESLIAFLRRRDPDAARRAEQRYACFDGGARGACRQQALAVFNEMTVRYAANTTFFDAMQDARVVMNADAFDRAAANGGSIWNVRVSHMADSADAIVRRLDAGYGPSRVALWLHNTHAGDSRATDMPLYGEFSVGALLRDRWPGQTFHIGFSMYGGSVMAATAWNQAGQVMTLREAIPGSDAALMHATGLTDFYVLTGEAATLATGRWQRAVGVVYAPATEAQSHYFFGHTAGQYDALIHIDRSTAATPLDSWPMRRRAVR